MRISRSLQPVRSRHKEYLGKCALLKLVHELHGSYISMENWEENEKLHFSVIENSIAEVKALVESGFSMENFDLSDKTPLHYAVEAENFQITRYLLEHGADVNAQEVEKCGNTPLGSVGATCSLKMAKLLVEFGANPATPGWMQISAVDRAKDRKKPEGIQVYEFFLEVVNT